MDYATTIKEIKNRLRLCMNGAAAGDMRSHGIEYHLNFGVTAVELKKIASDFEKDCGLACALWKENIRECRILATMLMPPGEMDLQLAELWLGNVQYPDLAEQFSFNLLRNTRFAGKLAFRWIAGQNDMAQYCGYLILASLIRSKGPMNQKYKDELTDQAHTDLNSSCASVRTAAQRVLEIMNEKSESIQPDQD